MSRRQTESVAERVPESVEASVVLERRRLLREGVARLELPTKPANGNGGLADGVPVVSVLFSALP